MAQSVARLAFRVKIEKLSGWIFMWCKNIPAHKKSALSVKNCQFWNFGRIFGDLAPLCPPFRVKIEKLSGWISLWCKIIPPRKKSAQSVEKRLFWNFGRIFGGFYPSVPPILARKLKN